MPKMQLVQGSSLFTMFNKHPDKPPYLPARYIGTTSTSHHCSESLPPHLHAWIGIPPGFLRQANKKMNPPSPEWINQSVLEKNHPTKISIHPNPKVFSKHYFLAFSWLFLFFYSLDIWSSTKNDQRKKQTRPKVSRPPRLQSLSHEDVLTRPGCE